MGVLGCSRDGGRDGGWPGLDLRKDTGRQGWLLTCRIEAQVVAWFLHILGGLVKVYVCESQPCSP